MTIRALTELSGLATDFDNWADACEKGGARGGQPGILALSVTEQRTMAQLLRSTVEALEVALGVGWPKLTFTSSVYLVNGDAVLLVLHKRFGKWVPVGGRRKEGERPHEVAKRELQEETGVVDASFIPHSMAIDLPGMPTGLIGYHEHDAGGDATHMNFAFGMTVEHRNIILCDEHDAAKWVTSGDMDELDMPPNVRVLVTKLHNLNVLTYPALPRTW
jgi:8-oxo-dGTP diphosphatase